MVNKEKQIVHKLLGNQFKVCGVKVLIKAILLVKHSLSLLNCLEGRSVKVAIEEKALSLLTAESHPTPQAHHKENQYVHCIVLPNVGEREGNKANRQKST